MRIPFFAFRDHGAGMAEQVRQALAISLEEQEYILGRQVGEFEQAFARYLNCRHVIGTGNGYDALLIALKALGIQEGDKVIVPANGFVATANAITNVGARPVLADPDEYTCNLTAQQVERHLSSRTKAIIPVHLYGQACAMADIMALAAANGLLVLEDFAQSQGARYQGQLTGTFGQAGATSFYPIKNLGALGDGGAVVTNDTRVADFVRKYHNYGQKSKYFYEMAGVNSRLDTLQAAVLLVKLSFLDQLNAERKLLARLYLAELEGIGDLVLPVTAPDCDHVYHIFAIRSNQRDALQAHLATHGVQTLIHYPVPIHLQQSYRSLGYRQGDFPVAEKLASTSLSLPLFPGLQEQEVTYIIDAMKKFFQS